MSVVTTSSTLSVTLPFNMSTEQYLKKLEDSAAVELLPTLILLGLLSIVGNLGNAATLFVYYTRFKPSSTRSYILAMSVFDILFDTFSMPGEIIDLRFSMTYRAKWLCRMHRLITGFLTVVSACILVAVAIDRRRKICRPFRPVPTPRKVTLTLVICSSVSFALAVPFCVMNGTHSVETAIPGVVGSTCSVDAQFIDTIFPLAMNAVFLLVFLSCVVIMVISYVQIGRKVMHHKKKLATQTDQNRGAVATLALALTQLDSAGHSAEHEDSKDSNLPRESSSKADVESLPRASNSDDAPQPATGRFSLWKGRRGVEAGGGKTGDSDAAAKGERGGCDVPGKPPGKFNFLGRKGQIPALQILSGGGKHAAADVNDDGDDDLNDDVFATPTPTTRGSPRFHFGGSTRQSESPGKRNVHDDFEMAFKTLAHAVSEDTLRSHSDPGQNGDRSASDGTGIARSRSASVGDELFHVRYIAEFVRQDSKTERAVAGAPSSRDTPLKKTTRGNSAPTGDAMTAAASDAENGDISGTGQKSEGRAARHHHHNNNNNNNLDVKDTSTSSESKRRSRSLPEDSSVRVSRGGSGRGRVPIRPKAKSTSSASGPHEGRFRSFVRTTLRRAMTLGSEGEEGSSLEPGVTSTLRKRRRTVRKIPSRTTWMMFVLTAIFVLSYLPYLSLVIVRAVHHGIEADLSGWTLNAYTIGLKSYFINSVVNPIVYSFCSARFRHQCRYIFRSKRKFSVSG